MALAHAKPGEVISLHRPDAARTRALTRQPSFEAVHLIVAVGQDIARHQVPGRLTLHCLEGHIRLMLDTGDVDMRARDWIFLDRAAPHALHGVVDAALLLTILFDGDMA